MLESEQRQTRLTRNCGATSLVVNGALSSTLKQLHYTYIDMVLLSIELSQILKKYEVKTGLKLATLTLGAECLKMHVESKNNMVLKLKNVITTFQNKISRFHLLKPETSSFKTETYHANIYK